MEPLLRAEHITKDFPGTRALEDVSFELLPGEIHAIVGENGAGKSTLIRIFGGIHPHTDFEGTIFFRSRPVRFSSVRDAEQTGVAVIHQELMLVREMTAAENIFLGAEPSRYGIVDTLTLQHVARRLVETFGLELDIRSGVRDLSLGAQQLVEIVKALRKKSAVLILDEPTAALAEKEIDKLFKILRELKSTGVSIIYITHKLDEAFSLADRITVLRDGRRCKTAPTSEWTRQEVIRAMVGRELRDMYPYTPSTPGSLAIAIHDLTLESFAPKGKLLLRSVSLSVREGEVLGLAGLMGAGRTELLLTIFGLPVGHLRSGAMAVGKSNVRFSSPHDAIDRGISLVPGDRKSLGLSMAATVRENMSVAHIDRFSHGGFIRSAEELSACRSVATEVGLSPATLVFPVTALSGGNQQKVVIGKWFLQRPKILLMDEPTRGIDVAAKVDIYSLINRLKQEGTAVVIASSELPELLAICDRIAVMRHGSVSAVLDRHEATQEKIMEAAA